MKPTFHLWAGHLLLSCCLACHREFPGIPARMETVPVRERGDAADDLAVYVHPNDPEKVALVCTDKRYGLVVYGLNGEILHEYPVGRINNVDLRQGVPWPGGAVTLVAATNRTDNTLVFYTLDPATLALRLLHLEPVPVGLREVYGCCLYLSSDACHVFVSGKEGMVEQYRLSPDPAGRLLAERVRRIAVGGTCEGMVADDEHHVLYIAEEDRGIWRYDADAGSTDDRVPVDGIRRNPNLRPDLEGLALYRMPGGEGLLFAASQGNDSFAVYGRTRGNPYLGSFRISAAGSLGAVSETDGIEVSSLPTGPFRQGMFFAQDGDNRPANQNFKGVDMGDILRLLDMTIPTDTLE
ncbi:MAG: hypothetical protein RLY31_2898 [Bacteroidota bacterium]|jgi:3-phytase